MDILLSAAVSSEALQRALQDFFATPDVVVSKDIELLLRKPTPPAVFVMPNSTDVPGFPLGLSFMVTPEEPDGFQALAVRLSQRLASRFDCDAMCDGTAHGRPPSPYWSILWREGRAYLACDLAIDEDPPGPPKILRRLPALEIEP